MPHMTSRPDVPSEDLTDTVAYVAKRQGVSAAIVREVAGRSGLTERAALAREVERGKGRQ